MVFSIFKLVAAIFKHGHRTRKSNAARTEANRNGAIVEQSNQEEPSDRSHRRKHTTNVGLLVSTEDGNRQMLLSSDDKTSSTLIVQGHIGPEGGDVALLGTNGSVLARMYPTRDRRRKEMKLLDYTSSTFYTARKSSGDQIRITKEVEGSEVLCWYVVLKKGGTRGFVYDAETRTEVATVRNDGVQLLCCFSQHNRYSFTVSGGESKTILSLFSSCFEEIVAETSGSHLPHASVPGVDGNMIYGGNINQYRTD